MNVEVVDEVRVVDERFYGDDEARPSVTGPTLEGAS